MGGTAKADVRLLAYAKQLIIVEAKIYSSLSGGTRNAPDFDQAARNIACITELLRLANSLPSLMTCLTFFVVAPEVLTKAGIFTQKLNKDAIRKEVQARAEAY